MIGYKLEWVLFVILSGIAIWFMFQGDGAINKYFEKETTYVVSRKSIKELPTILFCFHLMVKRDYDIFGKDIRIWFWRGVIARSYR